jgi:hypothetical protein
MRRQGEIVACIHFSQNDSVVANDGDPTLHNLHAIEVASGQHSFSWATGMQLVNKIHGQGAQCFL